MTVQVFASFGPGDDRHAGTLYSHRRRGNESASFRYTDSFLADPRAYALDPQLLLTSGTQHIDPGQPLFRAFADSSPDRWGRNLLLRSERQRADQRGTTPRSLGEIDILLGVRDDLRQGALRFRSDGTDEFQASAEAGVPALTDLPTLLRASDHVVQDDAGPADLALLIKAGSSLGGARPKAHVRDDQGVLCIAKFPSPASDDWDVMAWEQTALQLARAAGIEVSDSWTEKIDGRTILITRRFDRDAATRIGYASALTMLEASDGQPGSYLDVALAVEAYSDRTTADLLQLWRRIAFSVLISNTDDHLRNHGFIRHPDTEWRLSPAFDLNPDPAPGPHHLATAIDENDTRADITTLLRVAPQFRLSPDRGRGVLAEVVAATRSWQQTAARNGISRRETDRMAPAFEHEAARQAEQIISS